MMAERRQPIEGLDEAVALPTDVSSRDDELQPLEAVEPEEAGEPVVETGETTQTLASQLWTAFLATTRRRAEIRGYMVADSLYADEAVAQFFSEAIGHEELIEIIEYRDGLRFTEAARTRAAELLVDDVANLPPHHLARLVRYKSLIAGPLAWRLGSFVVPAVADGRLKGDCVLEICRTLFELCAETELATSLLTTLEKTGTKDPATQVLLLQHGSALQMDEAWQRLGAMSQYRTGWEQAIRQVILTARSEAYVKRAWECLKRSQTSIVLPDDRVPSCIRDDYCATMIEREQLITALLNFYVHWPEQRPVIQQVLEARSFPVSGETTQLIIEATMSQFPELVPALARALATGSTMAELMQLGRDVDPYITLERLEDGLLKEELSTKEVTDLFERWPEQRSVLISRIADLRTRAGLELQHRLFSLVALTQSQIEQLQTALRESLDAVTFEARDASLLAELTELPIPEVAATALEKLLLLPYGENLLKALRSCYLSSNPQQRRRITDRILMNPLLRTAAVTDIARHPDSWEHSV